MTAGADGRPTRRWIVTWTVVATVTLALPLLALQTANRDLGVAAFVLGFLGSATVALVLAHRRRPFTRYLPAILSTTAVGCWPLYRFLAHNDTRTGELFFYSVFFLVGFLTLDVALKWVRERGWVVDSPFRRGLTIVAMMAMVGRSLLHFEHPGLRWGVVVAMFATMFWPSRKPAVLR